MKDMSVIFNIGISSIFGVISYCSWGLIKDIKREYKMRLRKKKWKKESLLCAVCNLNEPVSEIIENIGDLSIKRCEQLCESCISDGWAYIQRCSCDFPGWYKHEGDNKYYLQSHGTVISIGSKESKE